MTKSLSLRHVLVVAAVAVLAGYLASIAGAQAPATGTERTLVATGVGTAKVTPRDRNDNKSIVAAVEAADQAALPRSIAEAREEAGRLAAAAGVALGPLLSISNSAAIPSYFGPYYGPYVQGAFGPGRYCGTVRRSVFRRNKQGKRVRVGSRARRVCRVPREVSRTVTLTFAITVPAS